MKVKWQVKLLQPPVPNLFKNDYFPRNFAYKRDAIELKAKVERDGGKAEVARK